MQFIHGGHLELRICPLAKRYIEQGDRSWWRSSVRRALVFQTSTWPWVGAKSGWIALRQTVSGCCSGLLHYAARLTSADATLQSP